MQLILDDLRDARVLHVEIDRLQFTGDVSCYELHCCAHHASSERTRSMIDIARHELTAQQNVDVLPLIHDSRLKIFLSAIGGETNDRRATFESIKRLLETLTPAQHSCVNTLTQYHQSPMLIAVAFVAGRLSNAEYARAMIALVEHTDEGLDSLSISDQMARFDRFRRGAWRVERFLDVHRDSLRLLIESGETDSVEFKSTWRYNLSTKQPDRRLVTSVLKTIAAFLNTEGGTLVIGVNDGGSPIPNLVRLDGFPNEDRYLLHIISTMRNRLGDVGSGNATVGFSTYGCSRVCVIRCAKSDGPVFLEATPNKEDYFVRIGPSSVSLPISEAVKHIRSNFPSYGVKDL